MTQYKLVLAKTVTSGDPFNDVAQLICCLRQNIGRCSSLKQLLSLKPELFLFWRHLHTDKVDGEGSESEQINRALQNVSE